MATSKNVSSELAGISIANIFTVWQRNVILTLRITSIVAGVTAFCVSILAFVVLLRRYCKWTSGSDRARAGIQRPSNSKRNSHAIVSFNQANGTMNLGNSGSIGRSRTSRGDLGFLLLELTEVIFCSAASSWFLYNLLTENNNEAFYFYVLSTIFLRNGWITLFTLFRCIVIVVPLKARNLVTARNESISFLAVLLFVSCCTAGLYYLDSYKNSVFLITTAFLRSFIPVCTVLILSVVMAVRLYGQARAMRRMSRLHELNSQSSGQANRTASRITLFLAIAFVMFESVGVVLKVRHFVHVSYGDPHNNYYYIIWQKINDICLACNSVTNFFIFYFLSNSFRGTIRGWYNSVIRRSTRRRGSNFNNSGMTNLELNNGNHETEASKLMNKFTKESTPELESSAMELLPAQNTADNQADKITIKITYVHDGESSDVNVNL